MQEFVDFDEYGNAIRDFVHNPVSYMDRVRENDMFDDRSLVPADEPSESYWTYGSRLPKERRHYGNVRVYHKGKHYVVSGQMVHSVVPSFQQAASGYNMESGEAVTKYPIVSEDREVHTSPMWPVSTTGSTMRVGAPLPDETFDQNVKKSELHIGAPIEGEDNKSFFSIHGISSLISASLKAGASATNVFSFKPEASKSELTIASKMAPALDSLKDKCHEMSVDAEMMGPINKKLASPVHLVIEEHPPTAFANTYVDATTKATKTAETVPLTNATAHINAMKVSAPIKNAMIDTLAGTYMSKRLQSGVTPIKVEAFYGKGRAFNQVAAPQLPHEDNHRVHTYSDEPSGTMYVGLRLNDSDTVVCHVTTDADKQSMTTIKSVPSPVSDTMLTKVTNMNGKSFSAQRVQSPYKAGVRGTGKALTFVH